jgi:hypothetical protein
MFGAILKALAQAVLIVSVAIGLTVGLVVTLATQNAALGGLAGIAATAAFALLCYKKLEPQVNQ